MTKFKIGDRVVVPEDARESYGTRAARTGHGVIKQTVDSDGDVAVLFDGDTTYCYVLASDVKREKVFVQPGDVSVGDRVRIRVTTDAGDKFKYEFVVTDTAYSTLYFAGGSVPHERAGSTRTIEILEKASVPEPEPEPLKVGDTVEGERQYADLPVGTFVAHLNGLPSDALIRTNNGWTNVLGGGVGTPYLKRTIVWLPEVSN